MVHICDVAGAAGHVNKESSLVYTAPSFKAMQAMQDAVLHAKTEQEGYNFYIDQRAAWLGVQDSPHKELLARLAASCRLFSPKEGAVLQQAIEELSVDDRNLVLEQFSGDNFLRRTPTYIPAVLVNAMNNPLFGTTPEERLRESVKICLPFMAKVLAKHKADRGKESEIPLNFNPIAGRAKEDPKKFITGLFEIQENGAVRLLDPVQ